MGVVRQIRSILHLVLITELAVMRRALVLATKDTVLCDLQ